MKFRATNLAMGVILAVASAVFSRAAAVEKVPSSKSSGQFTDFDAFTQPATPHQTSAALTNTPSSIKNDAGLVSNVLAAVSISGTNAGGGVGLNGYVPDDKYKLRIGDKVSFQILEDRDPVPKSLLVADSGELDVPYIGRYAVVDKTCKQLVDELKAQLEKEYYFRATVVLALDTANKVLGRIYVWGQVKNQGPIELAVNENLTVGKAILRAGGFGDFANKKRVKIVRGAEVEGPEKKSFELNLAEILEKGQTEKDVVLRPDDSIIVPAKLVNF